MVSVLTRHPRASRGTARARARDAAAEPAARRPGAQGARDPRRRGRGGHVAHGGGDDGGRALHVGRGAPRLPRAPRRRRGIRFRVRLSGDGYRNPKFLGGLGARDAPRGGDDALILTPAERAAACAGRPGGKGAVGANETLPRAVRSLAGGRVVAVSASQFFTLAVSDRGALWASGRVGIASGQGAAAPSSAASRPLRRTTESPASRKLLPRATTPSASWVQRA